MSGNQLAAWWRDNVILVIFVIAQAAAMVWWSSQLTSRVGYIETYGSPQLASLTSRLASLETEKHDRQRLLVRVEEMGNRMAIIESRVSRVEDRQQSVLEVMKANGAKIDAIGESILKHMQETSRNSR